MLNLNLLWSDIASHLYVAAVCLVVASLVALARARIVWIDSRLPKAIVPYVPIALAVAAVFFGDLGESKALQQAVSDAVKVLIASGLLAAPGTLGMRKKEVTS
jgi:hypothetical protein